MAFFTRPDLSDIQFRQLSGSSITMSGTTDFVGILKSKGVEIDATLTGATSGITGHVLTYIDGKIQLAPSTGGDTDFDSSRVTTRSGIPAVTVNGTSVKDFLEGYFFPSVPPTLAISGGGTRLFGDNAGFTLSWSVTRRTQPLTSVTVKGIAVTPSSLYTSLGVDGVLSSGTTATITTPNTNQSYLLNSTTATESVNASTTVSFSHKRFYFGNNIDLIALNDANTSIQLNLETGATTSEFSGTKVKSTFSITLSSQYFYFAYPTSFGNASFTINGLLNTDFSSKDFTFTNQNGYPTTFRIYRTNNLLNGMFNIAVA